MTPLLEVENLSVEFGTEDGVVRAVRGVSLRLEAGEVLGVVGESGCGKSVTAAAVMGLLPRSAAVTGSIRFADRELVGRPEPELRALRGNRIGMIFQDPMTSLNPVYTVGWQLAEAFGAHNTGATRRRARAKAVAALEQVGIPQPDRRADAYPHEFSGGMRQRAMIAMAIINDPALIIADEPTTALDVTVQAQILDTLRSVAAATEAAIMLITHDLGVVAGMADRVQVMYGGTVVETAETVRLFEHPRMPYTVGLLGSVPDPARVGRPLTPIPGSPPSPLNLPHGCTFGPRCPLAEPECRDAEPALGPVDAYGHRSRCRRWRELAGDPAAAEVFSQAGADDGGPGSVWAATVRPGGAGPGGAGPGGAGPGGAGPGTGEPDGDAGADAAAGGTGGSRTAATAGADDADAEVGTDG